MRIFFASAIAALCLLPVAAQAQDATTRPNVAGTFGGFRIEGNIGWDKTQSLGRNNEKLGYGGSVGWDGNLTDRIVVGPEFTYWRPDRGENTTGVAVGNGTVYHQGREMLSGDIRIGYRASPDLLIFGKGGYVSQHQVSIFVPTTAALAGYRASGHPDGWQVGGGLQYAPHDRFSFAPANMYLSGQYVYSKFDNRTRDQHAMLGVGFRFR